MTSRDVIVALQRAKSAPLPRFPFARLADIFLAALWLVWLVAMLGGCSTDTNGLSSPIRGRIDVDGGLEATQPDVGNGGPDAGPVVSPDATVEETGGTVNTDGGTSDGNPSTDGASVADTGVVVPPSACPFDATRSLVNCTSTTALCRTYDTPGHAVLQVDCIAEGYLCVPRC